MRTEHDLRDALRPTSTEPARADRLYARIVAGTWPAASRRRPALLLVAAAVLLAVLAGFALSHRTREAAPVETPTPTPTSAPTLPGPGRVEGNWRMVHRVDLPPGWEVNVRQLAGEVESTELTNADGASCSVSVWRAGTDPNFGPEPSTGASPTPEPLDFTINGRPAYRDGDRSLQWYPSDEAVAAVTCDYFELSRTVAERVVFEPTVLRVPLRFSRLPRGFRFVRVTDESSDAGPSAVYLVSPRDADSGPGVEIIVNESESNLQRSEKVTGVPVERNTIGGYPAFLTPGTLDLDAGRYLIRLYLDDGSSPRRWPPGQRELLVGLAESLEPARDLSDRDTWFPAEDAVPS